MKILYLIENFLPHISGYTIYVNNLASHFSKNNEVLIVTSSDKVLPKNGTLNNYKIKRLFSLVNPFYSDTNASYLASLKIKKIITDFQPDIIHIHDPAFISFFGSKFAKTKHIPIIYTQHANSTFPTNFIHDLVKGLISNLYQKFLTNFLNNNCDFIICPSKYIKDDLVNIGVKNRIKVISNGVDLNIFKPQKITNNFIKKYNLWNDNKPIILYVGRLEKDKNIDTLFLIIKKLSFENKINSIIIGNGEKRELFENEFNHVSNVKLFKYIDSNSYDLNLFYNYSSVFLMPSTIESQSLVTMEAMACGLPIVAFNGGALPNLVKNYKNGLLVNHNNVEEFTKIIYEIFSDKNKLSNYGKYSLDLIQKHDINKTYKQIYSIYQKLSKKNQ